MLNFGRRPRGRVPISGRRGLGSRIVHSPAGPRKLALGRGMRGLQPDGVQMRGSTKGSTNRQRYHGSFPAVRVYRFSFGRVGLVGPKAEASGPSASSRWESEANSATHVLTIPRFRGEVM